MLDRSLGATAKDTEAATAKDTDAGTAKDTDAATAKDTEASQISSIWKQMQELRLAAYQFTHQDLARVRLGLEMLGYEWNTVVQCYQSAVEVHSLINRANRVVSQFRPNSVSFSQDLMGGSDCLLGGGEAPLFAGANKDPFVWILFLFMAITIYKPMDIPDIYDLQFPAEIKFQISSAYETTSSALSDVVNVSDMPLKLLKLVEGIQKLRRFEWFARAETRVSLFFRDFASFIVLLLSSYTNPSIIVSLSGKTSNPVQLVLTDEPKRTARSLSMASDMSDDMSEPKRPESPMLLRNRRISVTPEDEVDILRRSQQQAIAILSEGLERIGLTF